MQDTTLQGLEMILRELDIAVRDMLAEDLPRQLHCIRNALDANDLAGACREVHAVRGSAAFCRLAGLRDAAAALETSLMKNEKDANRTRAFENNIENVLHALEQAKTPAG